VPRVLLAFEPPDGGVPENVGQLALGLAAHGWEAEVAGPPEALPYPRLQAAGVPVHRLALGRGYSRPDAEIDALGALSRLLRRGGFDLIHSHASHAGVLGRAAAAVSGTPSLYSPHCFAFASGLPVQWRVAAIAVERALGLAGGSVLCVCEHERQVALRAAVAPPERLYVVHNGCEPPPEGLQGDPALAALAARGPVAGAVAALREQKRLDVLIDATPLVLARAPTASVAIVGSGPLRAQLEAQAARLGLDRDERFQLLPFLAPAARALAALDVYVLPSAWESFPIGVLEALACGVPQVVTDVGGNREAVTAQTGAIVAPNDPVALADALVDLLSDPARRAAAASASRRRHAELFGVQRMVAETAAVYEAVLDGTQAGALRRRSG
jgi:glycosyltransferase involved in cell wall biosynthesis